MKKLSIQNRNDDNKSSYSAFGDTAAAAATAAPLVLFSVFCFLLLSLLLLPFEHFYKNNDR